MRFMLNGRTVTVVSTCHGHVDGIAVSVDGVVIGFRPTMAGALTLATVACHPFPGVTLSTCAVDAIADGDMDHATWCPGNRDAAGVRFDGGTDPDPVATVATDRYNGHPDAYCMAVERPYRAGR